MTGSVGNRELVLYAGIGVYPQISITKFELGTDKKFHRYTKVFWYMGGSKNGSNQIPSTATFR